MITKVDFSKEGIPAYRVEGKLTSADYDMILPELEKLAVNEGKFSVYIELVDFGGWADVQGFLKELKFDASHGRSIERCALVGDGKLIEWATKLSDMAMPGEIRFFPHGEENAARAFVGL